MENERKKWVDATLSIQHEAAIDHMRTALWSLYKRCGEQYSAECDYLGDLIALGELAADMLAYREATGSVERRLRKE